MKTNNRPEIIVLARRNEKNKTHNNVHKLEISFWFLQILLSEKDTGIVNELFDVLKIILEFQDTGVRSGIAFPRIFL